MEAHNMASPYLGVTLVKKIGQEGQNSFKTWISGKNSDFQIALESFFWTQKPSPSNPMRILTWNPMHQQNLCTHGLFLGLENIMSWSSKQTLGHFTVVIDKSFYGKNLIFLLGIFEFLNIHRCPEGAKLWFYSLFLNLETSLWIFEWYVIK